MEQRNGEVVLTQQGRRYALGRGEGYYGIWAATESGAVPFEQFPLRAEGWYRAWRRFNELEGLAGAPPPALAPSGPVAPGRPAAPTWTTAGPPRARPVPFRARSAGGEVLQLGGGLLATGVLLGIAGLFPDYLGSTSLASEGYQLLAHLLYLVGWAVAAALVLSGGRRAPVGALLGAGASVLTFGLYLGDLGSVLSGSPGPATGAGAGLDLTMAGWLVCAGGVATALAALRGQGLLGHLRPRPVLLVALGTAVAIGTAVTFALPWDRFSLLARGTGQHETFTAGNAFSNPGLMIAGDVIVMVLTVVAVFLALSLRPALKGGALLAGALLPLAAQLLSAVVQASSPPASSAFGVSPGVARRIGLEVTSGLTVWFFLFCAAVALLIAAGFGYRALLRAAGGRARSLPPPPPASPPEE